MLLPVVEHGSVTLPRKRAEAGGPLRGRVRNPLPMSVRFALWPSTRAHCAPSVLRLVNNQSMNLWALALEAAGKARTLGQSTLSDMCADHYLAGR